MFLANVQTVGFDNTANSFGQQKVNPYFSKYA